MLLQLGSQGADVKLVQSKLGITADGEFGPSTAASVRAWQSANGLPVDGIVGDISWTKMFPEDVASGTADGTAALPSGNLNLCNLQGIPSAVLAQIADAAARFGITSNLRLAHFLAQCAEESENFATFTEDLNYTAEELVATFPTYFNTAGGASAVDYANQPAKIASLVYANRDGNGNEASGDGYTFRGRGCIQLTGRSNYSNFGISIDQNVVATPDWVATTYCLSSAAYFFSANDIWPLCDAGATDVDVTNVTRRVNGGTNGLSERIYYFNQYYGSLTGVPDSGAPPGLEVRGV